MCASSCRPSVSIRSEYGPRVMGVVLTGKLDDGAAGLKAIEACGAFTIVQEPSSCVASDMPKAAIVSALTTIRLKDSIRTAESALPWRRRSR
ncbi:chemotaxis protein CheB [Paraburkholderia kirstenboschensis]|uniref:chemotaxis protein CheB n=1 Tax=Paraburkholderia kirstenboschensis TaxID=1245436 RepID=UPI0039A42D6A